MPRPFASPVVLAPELRTRLQALLRAVSTPQALVFRCRLIPINRPICKSPTSSAATAPRSGTGASVSSPKGSAVSKMLRARDDPGAFPPSQRVDVVSLATRKTEDHQQPATRWSLADIAATLINEAPAEAISRATIWRILNDADLKPHRSVSWLNSHDPDFEAQARQICQLYLQAPRFYQQGRLILCCDEKTGMQILRRNAPTQLLQPGQPEKREYEYIRLGTRALIATFAVPTGEVVWNLGPTRTNTDFLTRALRVAHHFRELKRFDWVVDNLNTHSSLPLCQVVAYLSGVPFVAEELQTLAQRRAFLSNPEHKQVFHYLPKHGSWLNQIELWFSVLSRRFLRRGDFRTLRQNHRFTSPKR